MKRRRSCENCREGIRCRACGALLLPAPGLLTARDYETLLGMIDGSDRKYPRSPLDTLAALRNCDRTAAKNQLQRLRAKLRRLLRVKRQVAVPVAKEGRTQPDAPVDTGEDIMRRAKVGELDWDEAERMLKEL